MRPMRCSIPILVLILAAGPMVGQAPKRDPLTPKQAQQIAEAGIDPPGRIGLFTKFLNEHADAIAKLTKRADTPARNRLLNRSLEEFSTLMDELGDNLDTYSDRKADLRKALKPLDKSIQHWQEMLRGLPGDSRFQVARDDALASSKDLADQTKQLIQDQASYFKEHKNQAGQERAEPE
ncbi:MAG: hypothetical protein ACLGRW_01150 [Acidobacteriota bacterium]